MSNTLETILYPVVDEISLNVSEPEKLIKAPDTVLFGKDAAMDSLTLVSFIVAVEQQVEATTGKQIRLVNDKAMSRKNSPFKSLRSMSEYIDELLAE